MGKLMVGLARILPLCAVVLLLPAIAAAQSVTLSSNQGPEGTGVTATGKGWPVGAVVHAFFNQQEVSGAPAIVGSDENFTLKFCVPKLAPGIYPTFFTISSRQGMYSGPIFTITTGTAGNCQATAQCPDAFFIGAHGTAENESSSIIVETRDKFKALADKAGGKNVVYYSLKYAAPLEFDIEKITLLLNARDNGAEELDKYIRGTVLEETLRKACGDPKIILVGYSLGAWVINEWLTKGLDEPNGNWTLWPLIRAVELYGDPLWYRAGRDYKNNPFIYNGLASIVPNTHNPYDNDPIGPASKVLSLANRWQSRCLKGDPVCGEGYPMVTDSNGLRHHPDQGPNALACANPNAACDHKKYTEANGGYNLTERGANYLFMKAFPPVTEHPQIIYHETFREGALVFFREFFTNPAPAFEAKGFGFVGVNGSGWAEENHSFDDPSYGRVHLSQPSVEYPFNHACDTTNTYESDVEAWINYVSQGLQHKSNRELNHLACTAPCEVVTPYAPYTSFTWDDVSSSRLSCSSTVIAR